MLVLAIALPARADQWVSPTTKTLTSPNKKWVAVITPADGSKSPLARASIGPVGGPATTFELQTRWAPVDSVLLDDGTLLTLDQWHRLGHGDVAHLYERDGKLRWKKTLVQLVGQSVVDAADHSVSSIWWRKTPLEWSFAKDGKSGFATLFDENKVQIAFKDGTATVVMVTNIPDDPERQLNRARSLARQDGQASAALRLLEAMLAKDPENYDAVHLYLDVAQRVNDHALAVAMLDRVSPKWKKKDAGYSLANVAVAWATSLVAVNRVADAERVLRQGAAAAPAYPNPVLALAKLLYDGKREADADAAIDAFLAFRLKETYVDFYSFNTVADFYRQRKQLAKALAVCLKGYKKTEVTNQFLYESLAQIYEELGKLDKAIEVNQQLLAHFKKQGSSFDSYLRSTQDNLARLRAAKRR